MSEEGGNDQGYDTQGNDGYDDTSTDTGGFSDIDTDNNLTDTSIQEGDQESDDRSDNTQASSDTSATGMMDSSSDLFSTASNETSYSDQKEPEYDPNDWDPTPGLEDDFDWDWDPTPGPEDDFDWDWDPTPGPENDFDWDWDPTPGPEDDFDWDWDPTAESDKKEISHNTKYDNEKEIRRTHSKTLDDYRQERDEGKSIDKEDKKSELDIDESPTKETEKKDTDKINESKGVDGKREKINFNREKQTETTLLSIEQEEKKQDDDADEIEEVFPKELPEDSLNREEEIYLPIKAPSEEEIKYVDLEDTVEKIHEKEEKEKKGVREEINDANMLEPLQDAPSEVEVKLIDTIERAQTRDQESHEHYDIGEDHQIKEDSDEEGEIRENEDNDVHLRERKPHEKLYEDKHLEDINEHRHDLVDKGHDDQYHQEIIEEIEVIPVEEESYDDPFDEFSDEEASENTRNIYEQEEYRKIEEDLQEQKEREEERIEQEMVQERIEEGKEKHNNIVQKVVDYNQINNERAQQEIRERKRREQREKDAELIRKGKELMERRRKDQELKEPVIENINAERADDHGFKEEETNEDSQDMERNIENQKRNHRKEMRPKKEEENKRDFQNQTEKKKEEIIRKDFEIDQNRLKKLEEEYRKTGHRPYYGGERTKGFDEYIKKVIDQEPKNNKAHCINNEIQKEHRETINEKRGSIKEEEWEKVLVKWIEEIDQEKLSKSERLRLIGILRIYRRLQELAKRKEYLKRKDSHMPLSKEELREFYEITAELEKVPEIFRRLWKRFWNFMNFYNKNSIWHKYLIKQNKQAFFKGIVCYYEQVILGRKVDISAQIKKLRSLNKKHKNIVLSILNKSTRSEEEIEELSELLSELGKDDLIKIFGEEYRDHTKYYVRLGSDYNQNIRRKMILDYIKELVNSNITSNLLSNEKDINIAEQGMNESGHYESLLNRFQADQTKTNKWYKEKKVLKKEDRTDLMRHYDVLFAADENMNSLTKENKISYQYKDWVRAQIKKIKKNIAQMETFKHKINMDMVKQPLYEDSPNREGAFLVEGKVIDSISELKNTDTEGKMITVIAEQGTARPEVADNEYQKLENLKEELEYAEKKKKNPPEVQTNWMRQYEAEIRKNAIWGGKVTQNYINWLEVNIGEINTRIQFSERQLKFKKTKQIKSNLDQYGQFADMIEGDKYEILVSHKVQSFKEFLDKNNLADIESKYCQNFGFFVDGERINDFAKTLVHSGEKIIIIPIVSDEGSLSPQFIKHVINPILRKVEGFSSSSDSNKKIEDYISENEWKLVKLWWDVSTNLLYSNSDERSGPSRFAPHFELFRQEILQICKVLNVQDLVSLANHLDVNINNIIHKMRGGVWSPHENTFYRIYTQLETELLEGEYMEELYQLNSLFHNMITIFGFNKDALFIEAKLMFHRLSTLLYFTNDYEGNKILSNNEIKKLDILSNSRDLFADYLAGFLDHEIHKVNTINNYLKMIKDSIWSKINPNLKTELFSKLDDIVKVFIKRISNEENIFGLIKSRSLDIDNAKRILLEELGTAIMEFFRSYKLSVGIDISSLLLISTRLSEFLFGDKIDLKQEFLPESLINSRPYHTTIFQIEDRIYQRTYENFINLFPEVYKNEIRSLLNSEIYKIFTERIVKKINNWCFKNHYDSAFAAKKKEYHYKKYGSNLEQMEFIIIHNIWSLFNHHYGKYFDLSELAEECDLQQKVFRRALVSNVGKILSKRDLLKVIDVIEEIKNSVFESNSIYDEVINSIKAYLYYRGKNLKVYRQAKFKLGRLVHNNEFDYDPHNIINPKELVLLENSLESTLNRNPKGSLPKTIIDKIKKNPIKHHSISTFSKGDYISKPFDKESYVKLWKELFNNEVINHNYLGLDKLNKLNKVAKYYRDHQNQVPKKYRSLQAGGDRHEWIIPQTFKQCKDIIFATGVNVYLIDPITGTILTGHIDLLARIGNDIFICDYKPRLNLDLSINNITDVFMDSVPQIAVYGLIFETMFGKKDFGNKYNLYCYTYNKDEGHIYKPLPALWAWKKAYKDFIHPDNPEPLPWEFLISDELNYDWWDKYY